LAADFKTLAEIEAALAQLDAQIVEAPDDLDLQCARAGLLAAAGRLEAAKSAYLAVLNRDPTHFATLNNFGALLYETDFRTAARTVFSQAVLHHPEEPMAHVNLAKLLMYNDELDLARIHYERALQLDPAHVFAHQQLSELLRELGDLEGMRRHRKLGFAPRPMSSFAYLGRGVPVPLLVLTSTPAGDVGWRKLVDDTVFAVTTLVAEYHDPAAPLPPHRLIFNAIGDADLSTHDLKAAATLVATSDAPVINAPTQVLATGRASNAERLGRLTGVKTPKIALMSKRALSGADGAEHVAAQGVSFPLLLRSPGFHTGRHFLRVDAPDDLTANAQALPGVELLVMDYLDCTGPDGLARKYRVMMIDGRLYPLHMAASRDWKVHYFTAAMRDDARLQAEEARFLNDMAGVLGPSAMAALNAVQSVLGLDYAGVDFGLESSGQLVVFEANAVMTIVPPDASSEWNYRRAPIAAAVAAARNLVISRAANALQQAPLSTSLERGC
jgi:glutathione synthase/RimK-type ligase-like ATP-grasp enzyme